ncbi:MAG: cupin domain-containing protein [Gemmatimonadetes bacterium]|nr:cupin domain-containing protein [Gemmatimonadota bacterium]MYG83741.1 cupin domain-containing protein [Gemmatimonadota bacterium]MYJ90400.1 cupin domain-containing protein [Gemmatimonadota bacterium]
MSIRVRNWRDQAPYVGHISALVWTLYQSHDKDATSPPEINRLHGINSFVKHGLQGHQHSDHHQHDAIEQLYFILRGRGQLLIGDDKVDVRDGTAVYMPVNVPHQAFNDGEGWMEHLIVSCPLDEIREGTPAVRDWRDVHPVVLEGGTVSWPLLRREEEAPAGEGGVLQRVQSVTRYAVQGRQGTDWQQLDGIELVHYVLSGYGIVEDLDGDRQLVTEGSAAHVLPGVAHRFANKSEGWLEYVTFAVEVGEVEAPDESDEFEESEEPAVQYGVEEVAEAAVVAEVDWDDADAVETEEEIEEDGADDGADDDVESAETEDEAEAEDEADAEDVAVLVDADVADEGTESVEGEDEAESIEAEDEAEDAAATVDEVDDDAEAEADDTEVTEEEEPKAAVEDADVAEDTEEEVEDVVAEDAEEEVEDVAEADQVEADDSDDANQASAKAEADDDDFDLEDDDADFDIEDEDETVVEDDTVEDDDDFPDADRR